MDNNIKGKKSELFLTKDMKDILQKTANILHISIETYVVNSAILKAIEFMKNHNQILGVIKQEAKIINELNKNEQK